MTGDIPVHVGILFYQLSKMLEAISDALIRLIGTTAALNGKNLFH